MRPWLLIGVVLVGSCTDGLGNFGDPVPVRVYRVSPAEGALAGGTRVLLEGRGFADGARVWVGGLDASDVAVEAGDTLWFTTPPGTDPGPADLRVQVGEVEGRLAGGFRYLGAGDEGGDGVDTDNRDPGEVLPSPTGLTTGLVELTLLQVACPACAPEVHSSQLEVGMSVQLHEPVQGSWLGWLPAVGTCARDVVPAPLAAAPLDVGAQVRLTTGSREVVLYPDGSGGFGTGLDLPEADFVRNASYRLVWPGGADLPAGSLVDAAITGPAFPSLEPAAMLVFEPDAYQANISRSGQVFSWGSASSGGTALVEVRVYDPVEGLFVGSVTCHGADGGQITVPGSALAFALPYDLAIIYVYRARRGSVVLPANGGTIESFAWVGVMGTGTIVP